MSPTTIARDIKTIDAWPVPEPPHPPRKRLRDPRFQWARKRTEHPLAHRVTVRVSDDLYQRLSAQGDVSRVIRTAIEGYLDTKSAHTRDDCALTLAKACDPDTQDRLVQTAERLNLPLWGVLSSLLLVRSKEA